MRTTSLLAASALFMALGSGCALDADSEGAEIGAMNPGLETADGPVQMQAPPVKIRLSVDETPFLAMFALDHAVGPFDGQMEHWFAPQVGKTFTLLQEPGLSVQASPLTGDTESALLDWTSPLSQAFSNPREVNAGDWVSGVVSLPPGTDSRLYWTAHPDDDREVLGIVLAHDQSGSLVATAWYRSTPPDEAGRAFSSTSWTHPLKLAVDAYGGSSLDPNDIRQADWHGIVMGR